MATLIKEKIDQAAGILRELQVDCWLTFTRESGINGDPTLAFLVEGDLTWHSAILVTPNGQSCAIVGQYDKKAVEDLGVYGRVIGYVEGIRAHLQEVLRAINPRQIAVNFSPESEICDGLTHGMFLALTDILAGIGMQDRLIQADYIIGSLRARKTGEELKRIRRAIEATEEIFRQVETYIAPGKSEEEIAAFMRKHAESSGFAYAWDSRVCPAVFTGPDTAQAHYGPTDRRVEGGHIVNMDFGLKSDGYCSDLQRTFYVLRPGEGAPPPEVQRGFDTIVRAIEQSRLAMRPGVRGQEIDAIARSLITGEGYEEFPHGLGHQVGRFAHDGSALLGPAWEKYAGKPFIRLEAGMVFTLEPRLTVPMHGVATVEEMVVLSERGAEYLSVPQKTLRVIRAS
ncbi:MAG TPA: Xaa-Pro peptidase family protein [Bacteroidota bacterium]|nr:Xaa-Pro peptidase family protein [Bacteroidota bacterium]